MNFSNGLEAFYCFIHEITGGKDTISKLIGGLSLVGIAGFFYKWTQDRKNQRIELLDFGVDTNSCDWIEDKELENVFWLNGSDKPSPVFTFSIYNHFQKPVVLLKLEVDIHVFPKRQKLRGIGSPEPEPIRKVVPFGKFSFHLEKEKTKGTFKFPEPLEIMAQRAVSFQTEVLWPNSVAITERCKVSFTLHFNDNISIKVPLILLNARDELGSIRIIIRG